MNRRRSTGSGNGSAGFLSRFARARSGAVAIWFAVMALPLAVLSFALIDINPAALRLARANALHAEINFRIRGAQSWRFHLHE